MSRTPRIVSTEVLEMARAPANKMLAALWRRHRLPSGQPPAFANFNLNNLKEFVRSLAILQPTEHGDFYYAYFGCGEAPSLRMDLTGHFHSEIDHPIADALADCFRSVLDTGIPLLVTHGNMRNRSVHAWEQLLMPVDGPFGRNVITHVVPIAFKSDLIGSILLSSPIAVLACAVQQNRNKIDLEVKIQAASQAAEQLFESGPQGLVGRSPIDLVPPLSRQHLMDACQLVVAADELTTIKIHLGDRGGPFEYDLTVTPFDGGLVLTFSDLTSLRAYFKSGQPGALLEAAE